jgi:hypothetical protein
MHRRPEEPRTAKRRERTDAMRDRVASQRDLCIAFSGEQAATRIARAVERRARDIGRGDEQERALRATGTDVNATSTTWSVRHPKLRDLGAQQCEHGVGVITGVLVDREDLEAQAQAAQVLGRATHGDPDGLLVVSKRQDDGNVEPGGVGHSLCGIAATVPARGRGFRIEINGIIT